MSHLINRCRLVSASLSKLFIKSSFIKSFAASCSYGLSALLLLTFANTAAAQIIVFSECNFQGKAITLAPGLYDTNTLRKAGVADDSIASIVVPDGFSTTLYADDEFKGRSGTLYAASSCLDRDRFDNVVSALSVQQRGQEQAALNRIAKLYPQRNNATGATFYSFCDYRGVEVELPPGEYRLSDLQDAGISNNDISSLKVPRGFTATLYTNDFFRGKSIVVGENDSCLRDNGIDEQISSVIVRLDERAAASVSSNQSSNSSEVPTEVVAYSECGYFGLEATLPPGEYRVEDLQKLGMPNNAISSIKVPPGYAVAIYENDFYRGAGKVLEASDKCLIGDQLNDKISSIVVEAPVAGNQQNVPASSSQSNASSSSAAAAVYTECGYEGRRANLNVGVYDAEDLAKLGIRDNTISSIKVNPDYRVDLFFFDFQRGKNGYLTKDDNCLSNDGFDNEISSIKVSRVGESDTGTAAEAAQPIAAEGAAVVYGQCDYQGRSVALQPGRYTQEKLRNLGIGNDAIASLKVQDGFTVVLYDNGQMRGRGIAFKADDNCLDDDGLFRKVSAAIIVPDRNQRPQRADETSVQGNRGNSNNTGLRDNNNNSGSRNNNSSTIGNNSSLGGGVAAVQAGLKCVGLYVQRNICETRRWDDMVKRCNLDEVPSMVDGYLESHVKAGNCTSQYWPELQSRILNPSQR